MLDEPKFFLQVCVVLFKKYRNEDGTGEYGNSVLEILILNGYMLL